MRLKIIQAGIYNDKWHKACELQTGDVLETTEGYGALLVEGGLAAEDISLAPEPVASVPPLDASPKPAVTSARPSSKTIVSLKKSNVFQPKA